MNECPYGLDISCGDCVARMIEEHNEAVRMVAGMEFIEDIIKADGKGYTRGVWEFYKLASTTTNTAREIYERLIIEGDKGKR